MVVTELARSGAGILTDTSVKFVFSGADHSSNTEDLEMHLQVKTSRKEMPGSNRVVENVMAATWQPITFSGEWNDAWGNRRTPALAGLVRSGEYANSMYQQFSQMVLRTPMVRVTLDGISLVGIITDLTIKYRTQTRIGYQFVLSPHVNESVPAIGPTTIKAKPIRRWIDDLKIKTTALNDAFDEMMTQPLKTPRADLFTTSLLEVNDAMNRLSQIGVNDGLQTDSTNKLLLLATTFRRLRGASLQVAVALRRLTTPFEVAYDDVILSMQHAEWIEGSHTTAMTMVGFSIDAEDDIRRRAAQKPRAIYYPKRAEPLEKISTKFYGNPDSWRLIYDANNLSSLLLTGDEELMIPEKRT